MLYSVFVCVFSIFIISIIHRSLFFPCVLSYSIIIILKVLTSHSQTIPEEVATDPAGTRHRASFSELRSIERTPDKQMPHAGWRPRTVVSGFRRGGGGGSN